MKNSPSFESLLRRPRLLIEIEAEQAARHLREFVRQAWPVVEPSTPFVPGRHIDAITEHLEAVSLGQIRNLLTNVPPRPERRWLFSSYGAQLTIRDSVKCRRLIESPWYH